MCTLPSVAATALSGWTARADALSIQGLRFEPDTASVPLASFVEFTERVAAMAGDELLGWTLGMHFDLSRLGLIHRVMRSASTLGGALRALVEYFSLMQDESEFACIEQAGNAVLSYRILDPDIWPRHQDAIFTLGIAAQLVRHAVGEMWDKAQLGLECPDDARATSLAPRCGIECVAGADSNWLRFPAAWLALPLHGSLGCTSAHLRELNRQLVLKRRTTTIDARVRALVFQRLGDRHICQDRIAAEIGLSDRTLRRHLAAAGTSFREIVDECRLRQAAHEFRVRGHRSIAQTALRLGYSEHSTFTRAFGRWSGMPPQHFIRIRSNA